jgi:rabenosyn-5
VALEVELEELLPQFQELLLGLGCVFTLSSLPSAHTSPSQEAPPTPEATAARKRILDTFNHYDLLAKKIRKLPCKPGSSQDRVQTAVMARANLFLQKNMFPLQSLPKATAGTTKRQAKNPTGGDSTNSNPNSRPTSGVDIPGVDPDSEVALALQPLLEQEALLESFVEEATAHRKFEDVKTLKMNLGEIRSEIERILRGVDVEMKKTNGRR